MKSPVSAFSTAPARRRRVSVLSNPPVQGHPGQRVLCYRACAHDFCPHPAAPDTDDALTDGLCYGHRAEMEANLAWEAARPQRERAARIVRAHAAFWTVFILTLLVGESASLSGLCILTALCVGAAAGIWRAERAGR